MATQTHTFRIWLGLTFGQNTRVWTSACVPTTVSTNVDGFTSPSPNNAINRSPENMWLGKEVVLQRNVRQGNLPFSLTEITEQVFGTGWTTFTRQRTRELWTLIKSSPIFYVGLLMNCFQSYTTQWSVEKNKIKWVRKTWLFFSQPRKKCQPLGT
jgi:hypothetical protein